MLFLLSYFFVLPFEIQNQLGKVPQDTFQQLVSKYTMALGNTKTLHLLITFLIELTLTISFCFFSKESFPSNEKSSQFMVQPTMQRMIYLTLTLL